MVFFFFSSRRRHTRSLRDWSSDVCSSDLSVVLAGGVLLAPGPLSAAVRAGLRARFGHAPALATDGAAGAASLALRALTGRPVPAALHERMVTGPGPPSASASGDRKSVVSGK